MDGEVGPVGVVEVVEGGGGSRLEGEAWSGVGAGGLEYN